MKLTIGIPTRGNQEYSQLLSCLRKVQIDFSARSVGCEIIFCINGNQPSAARARIQQAIADNNVANTVVLQQPTHVVGKVAAMNRIKRKAHGEVLLYLDDDVMVSSTVVMQAVRDLYQGHTLLVGCRHKIVRLITDSHWRNFMYDVINIQQIVDVFKYEDPIIFGHFLMLRKKDMPPLPADLINDDMYLSILFYPDIKMSSGYVFYEGVFQLTTHVIRVFRLMRGRNQAKKYLDQSKFKAYVSNKLNQRQVDMKKVFQLPPYFFMCFIFYRLLRIIIHSIGFFVAHSEKKWRGAY